MISLDLIIFLIFVMPGIVGAGVYRVLTVSRKMDQFDFVVFSLVLTFVTLLLALYLGWQIGFSFNTDWQLIPIAALENLATQSDATIVKTSLHKIALDYLFSLNFVFVNLIGVALGLGLSKIINNGWLFSKMGDFGWTQRTGRIDVWQDFFNQKAPDTKKQKIQKSKDYKWTLITLKDDRIYYGYLKFYSDHSDMREIVIGDVVELRLDETTNTYIEYKITKGLIYLTADQIKQIEVIPGDAADSDAPKESA